MSEHLFHGLSYINLDSRSPDHPERERDEIGVNLWASPGQEISVIICPPARFDMREVAVITCAFKTQMWLRIDHCDASPRHVFPGQGWIEIERAIGPGVRLEVFFELETWKYQPERVHVQVRARGRFA